MGNTSGPGAVCPGIALHLVLAAVFSVPALANIPDRAIAPSMAAALGGASQNALPWSSYVYDVEFGVPEFARSLLAGGDYGYDVDHKQMMATIPALSRVRMRRRYEELEWETSAQVPFAEARSAVPIPWVWAVEQRFTGKEREAETGLDYFGARYMSSAQGRFTSPDMPFADQRPQAPQSWNMYTYGRNNPMLYVDPSGNCTFASDASLGTPASAICADARDLSVSGDQINAIKGNEGKILKGYIAPEGFDKDGKRNGRGLTVGYGHLVKPGENTMEGDKITEAQADTLLVSDVEVMAAGVRKAIGNHQVSQQEFDAMVDMAFGIGSLSKQTTPKLLQALEAGDYEAMGKELRTDQATNGQVLPGLQKRSSQRQNIFLNGDYAPVPPPTKKKLP